MTLGAAAPRTVVRVTSTPDLLVGTPSSQARVPGDLQAVAAGWRRYRERLLS